MDNPAKQPGAAPDFTEAEDPFALFFAWMAEAQASEPADPEAMAVATVDSNGLPNVRMILLKGADERGFVFYTNRESAKGN
jgi:pyridoxamine 5'-phosphate oxidase